jgi:hypothetical protein
MFSNIFGITKKRPGNQRRLLGQKPPLKLKEVWAIRIHLQLAGRLRDLLSSIWRSIASFAPATWSNCAFRTCVTKVESSVALSSSRRRPTRRWPAKQPIAALAVHPRCSCA